MKTSGTHRHFVVIAGIDVSAETEVCDLNCEARPHETVACRQITVHEVLGRQVTHAIRDLQRQGVELRRAEWWQPGNRAPQLRRVGAQYLSQVPVWHEFQHHPRFTVCI